MAQPTVEREKHPPLPGEPGYDDDPRDSSGPVESTPRIKSAPARRWFADDAALDEMIARYRPDLQRHSPEWNRLSRMLARKIDRQGSAELGDLSSIQVEFVIAHHCEQHRVLTEVVEHYFASPRRRAPHQVRRFALACSRRARRPRVRRTTRAKAGPHSGSADDAEGARPAPSIDPPATGARSTRSPRSGILGSHGESQALFDGARPDPLTTRGAA